MLDDRAKLLNAFALLGINALLAFAFVDQFVFFDLPCPLCILQRLAFALAGFGFALNLVWGPCPRHYGFVIVAAVAGAVVSGRQILLHIVPGSGSYGDPLFGLHFYTWAFIAFTMIIVWCALLLMIDSQLRAKTPAASTPEEPLGASRSVSSTMKWISVLSISAFGLLVGLNALSTFLECSIGLCPDNPSHYELLR